MEFFLEGRQKENQECDGVAIAIITAGLAEGLGQVVVVEKSQGGSRFTEEAAWGNYPFTVGV